MIEPREILLRNTCVWVSTLLAMNAPPRTQVADLLTEILRRPCHGMAQCSSPSAVLATSNGPRPVDTTQVGGPFEGACHAVLVRKTTSTK
jgi:hypothetical protein